MGSEARSGGAPAAPVGLPGGARALRCEGGGGAWDFCFGVRA